MPGPSWCCLLSCGCVQGAGWGFTGRHRGRDLPCWKQDLTRSGTLWHSRPLGNCCCSSKPCRLLYYSWIPKVPLIANPLSKTVQRFLPWAPWRALSRWEHPCWRIMAEPSVLNMQKYLLSHTWTWKVHLHIFLQLWFKIPYFVYFQCST